MTNWNSRTASFFACACFTLLLTVPGTSLANDRVTLFAAASTRNAVQAASKVIQEQLNIMLRVSYGSSGTLARQITAGAPADLFLSANTLWMDDVISKGQAGPDATRVILSNRMVLVSADETIAPRDDTDLSWIRNILSKENRLSMGQADHVPAGRYAKQALQKAGIWADITRFIVPSPDVRRALLLAERQEVPLSIVYLSDATAAKRVRIIQQIDPAWHEPIRYPLALLKTGETNPSARAVADWLSSAAFLEIAERFGFSAPGQ